MNTQSVILGISGFVGLTAILSFFSYLRQQSSWKGTVVDKIHEDEYSDENGSTPERFKIVCKTDQGKKVTAEVYPKTFADFQIGDKAEKKKGALFPLKIG